MPETAKKCKGRPRIYPRGQNPNDSSQWPNVHLRPKIHKALKAESALLGMKFQSYIEKIVRQRPAIETEEE